ncbi:hypothetical protein GLOIN_2v1730769, partial [Rhizophagus irregularis DAOM 181602=DAOM 197198]
MFLYFDFFNETYINVLFFYFLGSTVLERIEFNILKIYTLKCFFILIFLTKRLLTLHFFLF